MPRQRGFTLVELMVTVAVMAIVLGLAVPNFEPTINASRLTGSANELVAALQTARMEAIRRNRRIAVCPSIDAEADAPNCSAADASGWLVFVDADRSGAFNAGDTLLRRSVSASRVRIAGSPAAASGVVFRADGLARDTSGGLLDAVIDLCIPGTSPPSNVRHLAIGSGSRISVSSGSNPACAQPGDPL